jgi:hypothetical protein
MWLEVEKRGRTRRITRERTEEKQKRKQPFLEKQEQKKKE